MLYASYLDKGRLYRAYGPQPETQAATTPSARASPVPTYPEVSDQAGDTARAANTDEVKDLRREARDLKEVVAEQTLELRLLKKSMVGDGGDQE